MPCISSTSLTNASETREFVETLFLPQDLLELRLIETWSEAGNHRSRFLDRLWIRPGALQSKYPRLLEQNQRGANIFYGVNPRRRCGGKKADVASCRTLWADLDDARPNDRQRWSMLPPPSVIVDSGRGVHLYWRLSEPALMNTQAARQCVESILLGMYRLLASDAVQDVSRMLRLPGFANMRDFRCGKAALPCRLAESHPERRYALASFQRFAADSPTSKQNRHPLNGLAPCEPRLFASSDVRRIRGLIRLLDQETKDRSRRDFFVVVKLLELGCSPSEIAALVSGRSKFLDNVDYLHRTIENAARVVDPSSL